jgi:RNA binding exosome subunit
MKGVFGNGIKKTNTCIIFMMQSETISTYCLQLWPENPNITGHLQEKVAERRLTIKLDKQELE